MSSDWAPRRLIQMGLIWLALALAVLHAQAAAPPTVLLGAEPQEHLLRPDVRLVAEPEKLAPGLSRWEPQIALEAAEQGLDLPVRLKGLPYRSRLAHWGLARVTHLSSETDWVLYYRLATLERVEAFARLDGGEWLPLKGLHHQSELFSGYHYPSFALPIPKGRTVDIAVRIETRAPIRMPLYVVPGYFFYESQRADLVLAGTTLAVPLVVLLYLALLLPRTVHVGLGWFVALIALESVGAMWVSGHGHVMFPFIPRTAWPLIGYLSYMLLVVVSWRHLQVFAGRSLLPRWGWAAGWALVGTIVALGVADLADWANTRTAFTAGLGCFTATMMTLALRAQWRGVQHAGLYALAWSAFVASATISLLGLFGFAHVARWNVYYAQSSAAAILFGLVAVAHVRARERDIARERRRASDLQEALTMRKRFQAASSHDLRQPLQALGIHIDLAHGQAQALNPPAPRLSGSLADARAAFLSVTHFVDTLLDVARIEAKLVTPQVQPLDLGALVVRLGREHQLLAGRSGLELRYRSQTAWTRTDAFLLERVLRNLLTNAIRYTREGGVMLSVRANGDRWRVDVLDTGIGMAPLQQRRLLETFNMDTEWEPGAPEGLGLGLFVCRSFCQALNHPLQVRSSPGRGSRVSVLLPRAKP
jgi:signal transduction histidine kinase